MYENVFSVLTSDEIVNKLPLYGIIKDMKKKAEIRKKMKVSLGCFDSVEKARQTAEIITQFQLSDVYKQAKIIGVFLPMPFEFDITKIFEDETKRFVIPKTLADHQMIFTDYEPDNLMMTAFGVKESMSTVSVTPDLIVVPGLAWNLEGYRVGFGGGYYDRYLANFRGKTVSLVYDFQMTSELQPEKFDVPISKIFKV